MKKIFLTAVLSLTCLCAFAQDWSSFGLKAGIGGNFIPGTTILPDDDVLPNFGFYAGGAYFLPLGEKVGVQTELLYARKGIMTKGETFQNKYTRNIHYLELPVVFSVAMADGRYRVMVGPEVAYALGTHIRNSSGHKDPASTDALNRFNVDAVLQTIYLITSNLGLDVKFDVGLNRTFSSGLDKGHNMSIQVGLSYFFD